jgi:hypothetical protein
MTAEIIAIVGPDRVWTDELARIEPTEQGYAAAIAQIVALAPDHPQIGVSLAVKSKGGVLTLDDGKQKVKDKVRAGFDLVVVITLLNQLAAPRWPDGRFVRLRTPQVGGRMAAWATPQQLDRLVAGRQVHELPELAWISLPRALTFDGVAFPAGCEVQTRGRGPERARVQALDLGGLRVKRAEIVFDRAGHIQEVSGAGELDGVSYASESLFRRTDRRWWPSYGALAADAAIAGIGLHRGDVLVCGAPGQLTSLELTRAAVIDGEKRPPDETIAFDPPRTF